jgi:hypothetical protein
VVELPDVLPGDHWDMSHAWRYSMFVDCHLPKNHSFLWIPYLFLHWHHKTSCFVKPFFLEMLFFL